MFLCFFFLSFSVSNTWLYFFYVGFPLKQVPLVLWHRWLWTTPGLYLPFLAIPIGDFPLLSNKCSKKLALAQLGSWSQLWVNDETTCSFTQEGIFMKFSMPCHFGLRMVVRHWVTSALQIQGNSKYLIVPVYIPIKRLRTRYQPLWLFKSFQQFPRLITSLIW